MYEKDIREQKINIVEMVHTAGIAAHMSPAMAMLEIFNVLLRDVMNIENGIEDEGSDQLVLSNGHTALALYAVYETLGIITKEEFYTYKKRNSRLGVHQDRHHTPGTIISTGSLGHGLPNAVGMAYAWKLQGKTNRMFITVGDGELNEGSIWESVIFAARMKLDNVCCIIDDNKSTEYMPDILEKFRAFEWEAVEIDGHDEDSLRKALLKKPVGRPYVVIADTVKGHGVRMFEENHAAWHEKAVSDEDYVIIMEELR
jgi:transketolase